MRSAFAGTALFKQVLLSFPTSWTHNFKSRPPHHHSCCCCRHHLLILSQRCDHHRWWWRGLRYPLSRLFFITFNQYPYHFKFLIAALFVNDLKRFNLRHMAMPQYPVRTAPTFASPPRLINLLTPSLAISVYMVVVPLLSPTPSRQLFPLLQFGRLSLRMLLLPQPPHDPSPALPPPHRPPLFSTLS